MQYETWTIEKINDDETVEVTTGLSREDALRAIRVAMHGGTDPFDAAPTDVHELPLAA